MHLMCYWVFHLGLRELRIILVILVSLSTFLQVLSLEADLSKDEDCKRVVSSAKSQFDRIDILVNSAGMKRYLAS